ncbi:hypothetical protein V6N13_110765 [Hibiscus sabdariffa]
MDLNPYVFEVIQWQPPPTNHICLNTNGAVSHSSKRGSCRGLFRDHFGNFLGAYVRPLGLTTILHAELWGIYEGLQLARQKYYANLEVQTENTDVLDLLSPSSLQSP